MFQQWSGFSLQTLEIVSAVDTSDEVLELMWQWPSISHLFLDCPSTCLDAVLRIIQSESEDDFLPALSEVTVSCDPGPSVDISSARPSIKVRRINSIIL
jgi:hypothetical protein